MANDDTNRIFLIEELTGANGDEPLRFEWDSSHQSSPRHGWDIDLTIRTQREDYPQSNRPSEQVLGPKYETQEFHGMWDDRYNPIAGDLSFAELTHRNLEDVVKRGKLVKISFEALQFVGLITNLKVTYLTLFRRIYSFKFSPHYQVSATDVTVKKVNPPIFDWTKFVQGANAILDKAEQLQEIAPLPHISAIVSEPILLARNTFLDSVTNVNLVFQNQTISVVGQGPNSISRAVQSFQALQTSAVSMLEALSPASVATGLAYDDAVINLQFEQWIRETAFLMRQTVVFSRQAAVNLNLQVKAKAIALYRPSAGESLYGISNQFYGTPFSWQEIAARNNLYDFTLNGTELLVIPDIG